jgi:hypothetical protein
LIKCATSFESRERATAKNSGVQRLARDGFQVDAALDQQVRQLPGIASRHRTGDVEQVHVATIACVDQRGFRVEDLAHSLQIQTLHGIEQFRFRHRRSGLHRPPITNDRQPDRAASRRDRAAGRW